MLSFTVDDGTLFRYNLQFFRGWERLRGWKIRADLDPPPAFPICLINHNTSTASSFNAARLTYYFCVSRELVIITPALFHFPYWVGNLLLLLLEEALLREIRGHWGQAIHLQNRNSLGACGKAMLLFTTGFYDALYEYIVYTCAFPATIDPLMASKLLTPD